LEYIVPAGLRKKSRISVPDPALPGAGCHFFFFLLPFDFFCTLFGM